jgi:hypothetical protein
MAQLRIVLSGGIPSDLQIDRSVFPSASKAHIRSPKASVYLSAFNAGIPISNQCAGGNNGRLHFGSSFSA